MIHVALWEPEIPPNTGNIGRSCVATGSQLHLIGKLGFQLDDKAVKRAGLDYWDSIDLRIHASFEDFLRVIPEDRIICIETSTEKMYTQANYQPGICLLFGNESSGLPSWILEKFQTKIYGIPMPNGIVRSLNLATSAGIVLYEAMRQIHQWGPQSFDQTIQ